MKILNLDKRINETYLELNFWIHSFQKNVYEVIIVHSVHPLRPFSWGEGLNLLPNFQRGVGWQDLNF